MAETVAGRVLREKNFAKLWNLLKHMHHLATKIQHGYILHSVYNHAESRHRKILAIIMSKSFCLD